MAGARQQIGQVVVDERRRLGVGLAQGSRAGWHAGLYKCICICSDVNYRRLQPRRTSPIENPMAERSFAEEVKKLQPRRGRDLRRRRHPGRHQGAAAVGRGLRGRLPGLADLAPDGRAGRRAGHPGRDGRALRVQRQRGHGRGHAGGAASTTRCAARSPSNRQWAPTSRPTRWPTWPRAASPAARWSSSARTTATAPASCRSAAMPSR